MTELPAGLELRTLLDAVAPVLHRDARRLWQEDGLVERYRSYLVTMHTVVRASVPLMELALRECRREDRVAQVLAAYLPEHIEQERGHDDWLERDMEAAGLQSAVESARLPSAAVARMVGAQYYWIRHYHPICLFGYMAVLELHAPRPDLADALTARSGLPGDSFETLRLHADLDPTHSAALLRVLDEARPDAALRCAVRLSALHTVARLTEVFDSLYPTPTKD